MTHALCHLALAAVMALAPALSDAAETACPQHFVRGTAPDLANPKLAARTRELCYSEFAVLHSGVTRTPLWSAGHLTRAQIDTARALDRDGTFHPDPNLPKRERAELADYARSGFDRGHMAPSGDMPDRQAQQESFTLANIVPQNPNNNRDLWSDIEAAVRARIEALHRRLAATPAHGWPGLRRKLAVLWARSGRALDGADRADWDLSEAILWSALQDATRTAAPA